MALPWSAYQEVVEHTFTITNEAVRSDFLNICYANDISDDVIDGFDSLNEGRILRSVEEAKEALRATGALSDD